MEKVYLLLQNKVGVLIFCPPCLVTRDAIEALMRSAVAGRRTTRTYANALMHLARLALAVAAV